LVVLCFYAPRAPRALHSSPTRRSSDLISDLHLDPERPAITELFGRFVDGEACGADALYILGDLFEAWVGDDDPSETGAFVAAKLDRKSTRLNSSHVKISYAVFCLKKKK